MQLLIEFRSPSVPAFQVRVNIGPRPQDAYDEVCDRLDEEEQRLDPPRKARWDLSAWRVTAEVAEEVNIAEFEEDLQELLRKTKPLPIPPAPGKPRVGDDVWALVTHACGLAAHDDKWMAFCAAHGSWRVVEMADPVSICAIAVAGPYRDAADYGENCWRNFNGMDSIPKELRNHINWASFAQEIEDEGIVSLECVGNSVYAVEMHLDLEGQ